MYSNEVMPKTNHILSISMRAAVTPVVYQTNFTAIENYCNMRKLGINAEDV